MPAIEVKNLTKAYQLGALQGITQSMKNLGARFTGRSVTTPPMFKALDNVSFTVEQGEVVGIIGHNGAGKSTLLKMLARISTPTSGSVNVNGRISPLIEVGAGFVPDFTGRENVYLNGSILGLSRAQIDEKFDEIVAFAEMTEFIDTPVKRYSSGMKVKLAFSVATSMESEILIVDEVLAVGDLAFQRKCFDRMEKLIKREKRTVLVVSHNLRQIARLCSRVLLLNSGQVQEDGDTARVCNSFYEYSNESILKQQTNSQGKNRWRNDIFELKDIQIINDDGGRIKKVSAGEGVQFRVSFELRARIPKPEIIIGTHTTDFVYLTANSTEEIGGWPDLELGCHEIQLQIDAFNFKSGVYGVRFALFDELRQAVFSEDNLLSFQVTNKDEHLLPPLRLVDVKGCWRNSS